MKYHERSKLPIVETLEDLKEAKEQRYIYVHARCPKCGSLWLSILPNAEIVLTKGCVICRMDEEEEDHDDWKVGVMY